MVNCFFGLLINLVFFYLRCISKTSVFFSSCFRLSFCPANFAEGPHTLQNLNLSTKSLCSFRHTSLTVLFLFIIRGTFRSGSFPGSFMYMLISSSFSYIRSFSLSRL